MNVDFSIDEETQIQSDLHWKREKAVEIKKRAKKVFYELVLPHLNGEQKNVVWAQLTHGNPVLCTSEAGTGKTRTLISKFILEMCKYDSFQFASISYTKTAMLEIRKRLNDLLKFSQEESEIVPMIDTFHSFCKKFCTKLQLMDQDESSILLKRLLSKYHYSDFDNKTSSKLLEKLRYLKHIKKEDISSHRFFPIVDEFEMFLDQNSKADFTRLLIEFLTAGGMEWICKLSITHFFIDEYQDQTLFTFEIVKQLLSTKKKVFIIGDPFQRIYSFSLNTIDAQKELKDMFRSDIELKLGINHRCHQNIVKAYKKLLDQKNDLPFDSSDHRVISFSFESWEEAKKSLLFIAAKANSQRNPEKKSIAFLFRRNKPKKFVEKMLEEERKTSNYLECLTAHSAKAREFDIVVIPFFVDSNFPHFTSTPLEPGLDFKSKRIGSTFLSEGIERIELLSKHKNSPQTTEEPICEKDETLC